MGACPSPEARPSVVPPLVVGSAGPERMPHPTPHAFGRPPAFVGQRWAVSTHATSVSTHPAAVGQETSYESHYVVTVLDASDGIPSGVSIAFETNFFDARGAVKPTAIHGKAYRVDAVAPFVHAEAGNAAPTEEEAKRVLDVLPDLGTRTRIEQVLPDGPVQAGDRRDDLAAAILRVVHPRAWRFDGGSAEVRRIDDDRAVFAVTLRATSESGLTLDVTGEASVRFVDARLVALDLAGDYGTADPQERGRFTLTRRVTDR